MMSKIPSITIPIHVLEEIRRALLACCHLKSCPNECGDQIIYSVDWALKHGVKEG